MDMDIEQVLEELRKRRVYPTKLRAPDKPGVCAVFATGKTDLPGFTTSPGQIIYIGITQHSLATRVYTSHFGSKRTGFSTARRSLGAILKKHLRLTALPRGKGATNQDFYCYHFQKEGEERLTRWMLQRLQVSVLPWTGDPREIKKKLIAKAEPLLNLQNWQNPHGQKIRELRAQCADEARQRSAK